MHQLPYGNMVIVAVAGGTGGIGRTLVDAILASGKHDLKILSRTVQATINSVHTYLS